VAVTQPSDYNNNDNNHDWDRNGGRDDNRGNYNRGNYDRNNGDWWRLSHRFYAVSPWQCRSGNGHVDWRSSKCWGGRFSGARLRWW
jgi:hypothetical protein